MVHRTIGPRADAVSVNFHLSVGGNNASQGTVDGVEFASENQLCQIYVLFNDVEVGYFFFVVTPYPKFQCWECAVSLANSIPLHAASLSSANPNSSQHCNWGSGGSHQPDAKVSWFSLANSIPSTDQESTKS